MSNLAKLRRYTQSVYKVTPKTPPVPAFRLTLSSLTLAVEDLTTGTPLNYSWNYGDGTTSALAAPDVHTYAAPGVYTFTLRSGNDGGYVTTTQTITVGSPLAAFVATQDNLTVTFLDVSQHATSWAWDFGDGTTSTDQNPAAHTYAEAGTYTVTLTVTNATGLSSTVTQEVGAYGLPPVAAFSPSVVSGAAPLEVTFTDASLNAPTNWNWTFGDGGSSTDQNPVHTYTEAGTYSVNLFCYNANGESFAVLENIITVTIPPPAPVADFSGLPVGGTAPLEVVFTDASTNATSWAWDFGDEGTSTDQNPTHVYAAAGTYTVTLVASGIGGSSTQQKVAYVVATAPDVQSLPFTEAFDGVTVGQLPVDWSKWDNLNRNRAAVAATLIYSGPNSLSSGADRYVRVWPSALPTAADVQVSAYVKPTSATDAETTPNGTGLFVRGSDIGGTTPTMYACLCKATYAGVNITKFNGSSTGTVLGSVKSSTYVGSGDIRRLTFTVVGSTLKARLYIVSGNQAGKYLQANGTLSAVPADCLSVSDSSIAAGGYCGCIKHNNSATIDYWDSFVIDPAGGDGTPPVVTLIAPGSGDTLVGSVTFTALATDAGGVQRVEFLIDDAIRATVYAQPYQATINTASVGNGSRVVKARAYDSAGNSTTTTGVTVTVNNDTAVTRPTITNAQTHIKIAADAYSATSWDATDDLVIPYVDVCVCTTEERRTYLRSKNANMHLLDYTNVGNLYGALVVDWLNYADANDLDREDAFYHAAQAYAYSGADDNSTISPRKFWIGFKGSTAPYADLIGTAWVADGWTFPNTTGSFLWLGHPEKFCEVNFAGMTSAAGAGWSAVLQYCSAVDGSGVATTWKTLTTNNDGTAGLTANGAVEFDPPADWVPAKVTDQVVSHGGDARFYYLRWAVTVSGPTTPPAYGEVYSRDYLGAGYTYASGTVPAFDSALDTDNDGYLTAEQWANRAAGKNARFKWETRLVSGYGSWRLSARNTPNFSAWVIDYHNRQLTATPDLSGFFVDNTGLTLNFSQTYSLEPIGSYAQECSALLNALWRAMPAHATLGARWLLPNMSTMSTTLMETLQAYCPAWLDEFMIRPTSHTWYQVETKVGRVVAFQADATPEPIGVVDSSTGDDRTDENIKYDVLCYYYLGSTAATYLAWWAGDEPSGAWKDKWSAAATYNVGAPSAPCDTGTPFATGTDPTDATLSYKVYKRAFANATVLFKPLSYKSGGTGVYRGVGTGTTHSLNNLVAGKANYKRVLTNGTLGSVITEIVLLNGEGAILVPQ